MDPRCWGNYAQTEFPPHEINGYCKEMRGVKRLVPSTSFVVLSMDDFIDKKLYLQDKPYEVFKACFPGWDNTPRKAYSGGWCFRLSDEQFATWLSDIIQWTKEYLAANKQYVYINAWNEWGEGAILEPTLREGYKNLEIVKECVENCRDK